MTTDQQNDPWLPIAIITRPHALRGGVLLKPLTRDTQDFIDAPIEKVSLRRRGAIVRELTLRHRSIHKGRPYVFFDGITDRNMAEELVGCEVLIPFEERWDLGEGRFYLDELEDLTLIDEQSGQEIGKSVRAEEGVAHDYLIITVNGRDAKTFMLPLIPEFVHDVNQEEKVARITIPEGLLDL